MRNAIHRALGYCPDCDAPLPLTEGSDQARCDICKQVFAMAPLESRLVAIENAVRELGGDLGRPGHLDSPPSNIWCVIVKYGGGEWIEGRFPDQGAADAHRDRLMKLHGEQRGYRVARLEEPE